MYLYIDEYLLINYKRESSSLKVEWKTESVRLNAESFINRLNCIYNFIEKFRPKNVLLDCKYMVYKRFNGQEDIIFEKILSKINESKIQKLAIVNCIDQITQTLINQLIFNLEIKKFQIGTFNSPILAESWLLSDKKVYNLQNKYLISA